MRARRQGGHHRASVGGLFSNVIDATHDYTEDWIDRFDDFEYDMRSAFDDVVEERDYLYDRRHGRRPLPERARSEAAQNILSEADLKVLEAKIESLTKALRQLKAQQA